MSVNEVLPTRLNFRELLMYFIPGFFLTMVILAKTYNTLLKIFVVFLPDSQQTPYLILLGVLFLVVSMILGVALDAFSHIIADIFDRVQGIKCMKDYEKKEIRFYDEASSSHISIAEEFFFLHNLTLSISFTSILSIILLYTFPPYIVPLNYFWLLIVGGMIFLLISIYWRRRNKGWIRRCINNMDINTKNNQIERDTNSEHHTDASDLQSDGP